jgi:hypothetical protein
VSDISSYEASRQIVALDAVIKGDSIPVVDLEAEPVAELVRVGLLVEDDGYLTATPAAIHYDQISARV